MEAPVDPELDGDSHAEDVGHARWLQSTPSFPRPRASCRLDEGGLAQHASLREREGGAKGRPRREREDRRDVKTRGIRTAPSTATARRKEGNAWTRSQASLRTPAPRRLARARPRSPPGRRRRTPTGRRRPPGRRREARPRTPWRAGRRRPRRSSSRREADAGCTRTAPGRGGRRAGWRWPPPGARAPRRRAEAAGSPRRGGSPGPPRPRVDGSVDEGADHLGSDEEDPPGDDRPLEHGKIA